jgi:selenocysteine lyase/cysteine desulfurase
MDPSTFRAEFPVLDTKAFLNAGTDGPVPRRAADVARQRVEDELTQGRAGRPHFERMIAAMDRRRELVAGLMSCELDELALTHSTTDGVNIVLGGIDIQPGDEILTSDEEHPGVLAPLAPRAGAAAR